MTSQWFKFHGKRLREYATRKKQSNVVVIEVTPSELDEIEQSSPLELEKEILALGVKPPCVIEFQPINSYGKHQGLLAEMRLGGDFKSFRKSNSGYFKRF